MQRKKFILICGSSFFTAIFALAGYRLYQYRQIINATFGNFVTFDKSLYRYDEISGYRYEPNVVTEAIWQDGDGKVIRKNKVTTDSLGHRTLAVTPTTGKDRYHIAVLGDSLTACIHNDLPWTDVLEDRLNRDPFFSHFAKKEIEVTNFARDGIGLVQFPAILESEILPTNPDLVIVNFINADIYREFVWRRTVELEGQQVVLNCTSLPAVIGNPRCNFAGVIIAPADASPEKLFEIKKAIAKEHAKKFRWLAWNPMPPSHADIENREEAISRSTEAIRKMVRENVIFLQLPTYWEILNNAIPPMTKEVMERVPNAGITSMLSYLPPANPETVNTWINFPTDMHFSDKGAVMYAEAIHKKLRSYIDSR